MSRATIFTWKLHGTPFAGAPVAGTSAAMVRSACASRNRLRRAFEKPTGHLFVERQPDPVRHLHIQEWLQQRHGGQRGASHASQRVIETELARSRPRMQDPQVGAV